MSAALAPAAVSARSPPLDVLHTLFLTILLPRLRSHGAVFFRAIKDPDRKEELHSEMVALGWLWFLRLAGRGIDATQFSAALARYAAKAVADGRLLAGQEPAKDVLSPRARRRRGFRVEPLHTLPRRPHHPLFSLVRGQQERDAYEERLTDNTVTPPPDAAAFRIDFPRFLANLSERDRDLALYLSLGHRAKQAATRFGMSPGRVTQLRQQWCQQWRRAQGDVGHGSESNGRKRSAQTDQATPVAC
jgi:hypothetical protein